MLSTSPQALSPRERRFQRTRTAILDAAFEIINTEGFEALSIRHIAEEIDYSPAALYDYFKNKDDIIKALCHQVDGRLADYLDQASPSLPPAERLVEVGMNYLKFASENPREYVLLFGGSPPEPGESTQHSSAFAILLDAVGIFLAEPSSHGKNLNQEAFAYSCWAFVHGMASLGPRVAGTTNQNLDVVHRLALTRFVFGSEPHEVHSQSEPTGVK